MNKTKRAVALRYERQFEAAPRIIAKGSGEVAEAMIRVAQEHGVTTREHESLVTALMTLELDSVIPPELFQVVAEVLAFVYQSKGK